MRRLPALAVPFALAVALLAAGCRRAPDPAATYRAFARAARSGDEDGAWAMLSVRSQAMLDDRARALSGRTGGVVPASGKDLLLGDAAAGAARVKAAVTIRESADSAVVRVETEGAPAAEVSLVKEGGAWRIVLPEAAAPR